MITFHPTPITTFTITLMILSVLMRVLSRGKPKAIDGLSSSGTIPPDKRICVFMIVAGTAILLLGAWMMIVLQPIWAGAALALLGLMGAIAPLRSLTPIHDVSWTPDRIDGPSKLSGLLLGTARTTIDWPDVQHIGYLISGYWYVESSGGRRVYWSPLHRGFGSLVTAIKCRRPDLNLPKNMR